MPETSEQVKHFARRAVDEALSGNYDLLDVEKRLKALEDTIKSIREGIRSEVMEEAAKHRSRGDFEYAGAKWRTSQRTTYDMKGVEWSKYRDAVDKVKELEGMLKAAKQPFADLDTGEIVEPPVAKVTETLSVMKY